MFSIQQIIQVLRRLQSHSGGGGGNFVKSLKWAVLSEGHYHLPLPPPSTYKAPISKSQSELATTVTSSMLSNASTCTPHDTRISPEQRQQTEEQQHDESNENMKSSSSSSSSSDGDDGGVCGVVVSGVGSGGGGGGGENASASASRSAIGSDGGVSNDLGETDVSHCSHLNEVNAVLLPVVDSAVATRHSSETTAGASAATVAANLCNRSQQIQKFYQQQLHQFHTQHNNSRCAKQKLTHFRMASLAAEPLSLKAGDMMGANVEGMAPGASTIAATAKAAAITTPAKSTTNDNGHHNETGANLMSSSSPAAVDSDRTCLKAGLAEILRFMELIGNLKHTKRTGWVLRDVNDCESISGHMYRMSMMTFLLDGSEGLNQIRCMELALVHDLAESLVGDITPFCGVSKEDKRAMELKAMSDICKLIEPRGKRIMELFEEYELGESEESKFVKDLDRLDMVMQAFEYEKRDNCLLKHQEFFDSTAGKFKHPFVKKLVTEIYEQRNSLAKAVGAKPPPTVVVVPNWDLPGMGNSDATSACDHSLGTKDSS